MLNDIAVVHPVNIPGTDMPADSTMDTTDDSIMAADNPDCVQSYMGAFILRLKAHHGLSQAAVDDIVISMQDVINLALGSVKHSVEHKLSHCDNDVEHVSGNQSALNDIFSVNFPQQLLTVWNQNKYFKEHFSLLEPVKVCLGKWNVVSEVSKCASKAPAYGYIVPFLPCLKHLLQMPAVHTHMNSVRHTIDGFSTDFADGEYIRSHELFSHPNSVKILAFYDDVEVVNPIGTKVKKNKLCFFFWMLLNVPPQYRSQLCNIQLLAVAKNVDCRQFGVDRLLNDFIVGLKDLFVGIRVDGLHNVFRGGLVAFLGDTLASNAIGGFKEGVGFARKFCRTCEATPDTSSMLLLHENCEQRTDADHREQCKQLELPLTPAARQYWSSEYGINGSSCLLQVPGFDLICCLVHDPMHLLFEGVTMYETKLFLNYAIYEAKFFTLAYLNRCIYDVLRKLPSDGRPNLVSLQSLKSNDHKLKQTAYQMWMLSHILPVIIGHKVTEGDEKWKNFLRLLQIQQLCTSPIASSSTITSLTALIARHNSTFQLLYQSSPYIPKMHYLVHLPSQLKLFGPLRHQWCMRMECKNSFFKRKKYRNTRNLPKSMSFDHQRWMCCQQHDNMGHLSQTYLSKTIASKPGSFVNLDIIEHGQLLVPIVGDEQHILHTACATLNGIVYKIGDFIWYKLSSDDSFPSFLQLSSIFKTCSNLYGLGHLWRVEYFHMHTNSFCVTQSDMVLPVVLSDSLLPWPLLMIDKIVDGRTCLSPISLCDVEEIL